MSVVNCIWLLLTWMELHKKEACFSHTQKMSRGKHGGPMITRHVDIYLSAPPTSSYAFWPQGHFMAQCECQSASHCIYITGQMRGPMWKTKRKQEVCFLSLKENFQKHRTTYSYILFDITYSLDHKGSWEISSFILDDMEIMVCYWEDIVNKSRAGI